MARLRRERSLLGRMLGAAVLDASVYREVAEDRFATSQALLVVVVTTIMAGIGGLRAGVTGFVVGLVASLIGWVLYAVVTYWLGTSVFRARRTPGAFGALLRALGFASSPRVLLFLGFIHVFGIVVGALVLVWTLVTTVISLQESLRLATGAAAMTAVLGWLALFVGSFLLTAVL